MIDTGADYNVMSKSDLQKLKLHDDKLQKSNFKLVGMFGQKEKTLGQKTIKCSYKNRQHEITFQEIKEDIRAGRRVWC